MKFESFYGKVMFFISFSQIFGALTQALANNRSNVFLVCQSLIPKRKYTLEDGIRVA
jgi:hypothetical protein